MENLFLKYNYKLIFVIVLSTLFCVCLSCFRMYKTNTIIYGFLLWNLFLAWIPFVISLFYLTFQDKFKYKFYDFIFYSTWLLFFPNSPYILTDIIHLVDIRDHIPIWYDLMLVISFSWTGLIVGILSLSNVHKSLKNRFNSFQSWIIIFFSIFLGSFGVYLGRYQRWNSWDLFTKPIELLKGIIVRIFEPGAETTSIGVTGLFTLFITISYLTFYSLSDDKKHV